MKHGLIRIGRRSLQVGAVIAVLNLLAAGGVLGAEPAIRAVAAVGSALELPEAEAGQSLADREREIDRQHLRQIFDALQAYRKKHDEMPNWLSDLYPDFLSDPAILMSPVELRTGRSQLWGYGDPKMRSSYIYEFNQAQAGGDRSQQERLTMKQWKMLQMEEFGPAIPMLRCHLHDPILNLSYSGDLYDTTLFWETDTNTFNLMRKVGIGPGAKDARRFRVTVVDAGTRGPIAGAEVKATNRRSELGPLPPRSVTTDNQGLCEVNLGGKEPLTLTLQVVKSGYAAQQFQWSGGDPPMEWTAELPEAVTVGGVVRDADGRPISGATVQLNGVTRDPVGQFIPVEYDVVLTDDAGRWTSDLLPKGFEGLSLKLTHPQFMPTEYDQSAEDNAAGNLFTAETLLAAKAAMVMPPAIRLAGAVVDEMKSPVADATVLLATGENFEQRQQRKTDDQGHFNFFLFEIGAVQLVVQAQGYAPAEQPVEVQAGLEPLTFTLAKGATLKGRVVDESGEAVSGAEVSAGAWHDLPLLDWRTQTDAEGRFGWDSAPPDAVILMASKSGFNATGQQTSGSADEEVTFRLTRTFQLMGKVFDAETKAPIPSFNVMRGYAWDMADDPFVNWERQDRTAGANGAFSIGLQYQRGGQIKFMVYADGYLPAVSPTYPESGWHTCDFMLTKGSGPKGIVATADGRPVEDAQVAMLGLGYLSLGKASFKTRGEDDQLIATTDAQGRFALAALLASPTLVAVHPLGYGEIAADELAASEKIVLQPWGHIEGVLKFGSHPAVDEEVMVTQETSGRGGLYLDFEDFRTRTDDQGRFTLSHVPPGERQLVRLIPRGDRSWAHSHNQRITVKSGETTQIAYGGTGRAIVGKVVLSSPGREADWNQGYSSLSTRLPGQSRAFKSQEAWREWYASPEVKAARENARHYAVSISPDGGFRIEDIPAGTYDLRIDVREPGGNNPGMGESIGALSQQVVVPEMPGGRSDEPLDLGELKVPVRGS